MNSSFVISDSVFRALGWALVHSLWQGACLALLLLVVLPKLRSAKQRYQAAYGTLLAVFLVAAGTFYWMFEPAGAEEIMANDAPSFGTFLSFQTPLSEQSFWAAATDWLEDHHVLIVLIWLLGFVFFLFRLGAGLWQVHKLQTQHLQPAEEFWQAKIEALGTRLGLKKAIGLFESALVRSPVAIGWLKPVILLPVGLINRLSMEEVEAILAHELAHIARRDWIFNLLQAFVEAIFYYHPAVWWVSAVVRRERENCCDDAALAATGNPLVFAKALVQVQELAAPAPMLALGIGGSSSRHRPLLLERIRRILNQPQQKSQVMEKLTATAILLALLTIIGLRANTPPTVAAALSQITDWPGSFWAPDNSDQAIATDTVPKPKSVQKITREDDNGKVEMEIKDGEITRLNVDGKEIPAAEFDQYDKLAEEMQRSIPPPPAPPMPPMPAIAPMPPTPPFPRVSSKLETNTDEAGNVVIKLQKDGKPLEIKVKDGEVWMDGKKLEKGEAIQLPGFDYIDLGNMDINLDHKFDFEGFGENGAPAIAFSFSDDDRNRWAEDAARTRDELLKHADEYRALAEQHRKLSKEDRKKMESELKNFHENNNKNQGLWRLEQDKWQAEQGKWQAEQEKWREELQQNQGRNFRRGDFQQVMKAQLLREKLITDPNDYSFQLSSKSLKVNGKKQSSDIHERYLELYKQVTGKTMEKGGNYSIEIHN